ncbi:hypothetical protein K504DRAFT_378842 [Pleomassaria siparia CBS 279.74]|uniref:RRM domain-containing protein n=1 Tax=Pleomassaria siparia CBS 279.74 TaxID=1314801 RepID=A0A6G1KAB5_9PLEO|nr:hypothetical protein K504DRAFT_378842 [Pleomassaria siparia CBS 279.74]
MPVGSGTEDYMLIVSGSSQYAPFLKAWKDFKDSIRRIIKDQPGWAEVKPSQRRGEMQAWCSLKGRDDAEAAYNYYTQARGVLVHLFKTSRSNGDFGLLKCNCTSLFPDLSGRSHSPNRSGIDVGGVNQYLGRICGVPTPQYTVPVASTYSYASHPQVHPYATPQSHAYYHVPMQVVAPQMSAYSTSASGLPVNMGNGAYLTEARGIFINNLNYKVGPSDLLDLLRTVGNVVDYRLLRDTRTGGFKGAATAKFATKDEAMHAVQVLNNTQHLTKIIHVRLDTDTTVVGEIQQPIIANGSNM